MKKIKYIFFLTIYLLSSCITNRDNVLLQRKGKVTKYAPIEIENYKLQPNDRVVYSVYSTDIETARLFSGVNNSNGQSQLSFPAGYRIYPDGNMVLPFIGKVKVAGLSCKDAELALRNKIRESLPDAEVRLALATDFYYIVGVGKFELTRDRITIYEALSSAGLKEKSQDKKHVRLLRRQDNGSYLIKTIDIRQESLIESDYYYIKPNDIFYIPTSNKAFYNISSFSGFLGFVMVPVSFLLLILNL